MTRKKILRIFILALPLAFLLIIIFFGTFYAWWNSASPEKTCASCHEIGNSVTMFARSAHRDLACSECHGTAMSNGLHSIREKGMMVLHHARSRFIEDIRLNQEQVLAVMDNCTRCHATEFAKWNTGGHSVRYRHIFLDNKHNETEQLNPDCLRCHGMFSDVTIEEVVEPLNKKGPWNLKNPKMLDIPAIPCLACHLVHKKDSTRFTPDYFNPRNVFYLRKARTSSKVSFYSRVFKAGIPAEDLPRLSLTEGKRHVHVSDDPVMRNCIQCHAPNSHHEAGTSDDRTPRGVHEGISCVTCHLPHSNDARASCSKCHPPVSNCKIDVTLMNTSYADPASNHNIHWVACLDCHAGGVPGRK